MESGEKILSSACTLPLPEKHEDIEDDLEEWSKEDSDVEEFLVFDETTQICTACDQVLQYPSYGPLCFDCHAFLYPDNTILQKELDEEKVRRRELERRPAVSRNIQVVSSSSVITPLLQMRSHRITGNKHEGFSDSYEGCSTSGHSLCDEDELLGLAHLSLYDEDWIQHNSRSFEKVESVIEDDLVERMPTERFKLQLVFSALNKRIPVDDAVNGWRNKRLRSELKQLLVDPPQGIRACPIDDEYSHWQASIEGPPDTVYADGIYYVHLELPRCYPMRPPLVRFLTRILHPNISRHGNVGMDCLRHNWSLALTIPKILVSVQSLLTDPHCYISMEPVVARMYTEDRDLFDMLARDWTRKFAMHHFQSDLSPWED